MLLFLLSATCTKIFIFLVNSHFLLGDKHCGQWHNNSEIDFNSNEVTTILYLMKLMVDICLVEESASFDFINIVHFLFCIKHLAKACC